MTDATVFRVESSGDDYWSNARRPFTSLLFLAPLLVAYEMGIRWYGGVEAEHLRNGADYWMREWLQNAGLQHPMLLPGLIVAGLIAWQIWGRFSWRVSPDTLVGMLAESLLFAFCLVALGQLQDLLFQHFEGMAALSTGGFNAAEFWGRCVSFIGAGVYEEVLFRLCLIPICYLVLRAVLLPRNWAIAGAVVATSVIFASAHYIGPAADQFTWFSFTFRALAGLFFAVLFALRGFGITVGCHAAYDVLVGLLLHPQY